MLAQWQPLEDPTAFTSHFRMWRRALKMAVPGEKPIHQVQVYGGSTVLSAPAVEYVICLYYIGHKTDTTGWIGKSQ